MHIPSCTTYEQEPAETRRGGLIPQNWSDEILVWGWEDGSVDKGTIWEVEQPELKPSNPHEVGWELHTPAVMNTLMHIHNDDHI